MKRYKFVCLINPVEGRDAEFDAWHRDIHLQEVLAATGFERGERMKLVSNGSDNEYQYLVIYEGVSDDPAAHVAKLHTALKNGELNMPKLISATWTGLFSSPNDANAPLTR